MALSREVMPRTVLSRRWVALEDMTSAPLRTTRSGDTQEQMLGAWTGRRPLLDRPCRSGSMRPVVAGTPMG